MQILARANRILTRRFPVKPAKAAFAEPVATITFDDFPKSAWTAAGPILEHHGVRATYYTSGRFCGRAEDGIDYYDEADLVAAHAAGHEIACHTFSHLQCPTVASAELTADLERNADFLQARTGERPVHFAYPYGEASPRTKLIAGGRFASSRGIHRGVNAGSVDMGQLKAVALEQRTPALAMTERWALEARARTGWLILFTHDVSETPSPYGCTPAELDGAIGILKRAGLRIVTVRQAMALGGLAH